MASLSGTLSLASRAMLAEEGAMQTSTNNLANVNTPGYSRQVPVLTACDPVVIGSVTYGNGVELQRFQSLRDRILDLRIEEEQQNQSKYQAFAQAMQQVQVLFNDPSGGIGGALTNFFNSVSSLTTQPDSTSLRQSVLSSAQGLATAFHADTTALSTQQTNLDLQVQQQIDEVNQLSVRIASLNSSITAMQNVGEDGGTYLDQRTQAIADLSKLLDVSVTQSNDGLTLTTANGAALVVDGQSYALTAAVDPTSSLRRVMSGTSDITSLITRGSLAGTIAIRDTEIPQLQNKLDALAADLSNSVNGVLATGIDLNGDPGAALFFTPPASVSGAAALMKVEISNPALLAMSTGAPGGNDVANALLALKDQPLNADGTPLSAYSQIVFQVGSDLANTRGAEATSASILQQLQEQQSAISGVSVDEEVANLMQFQRAFEAAAHVISVVDSMMKTVLAMGVTQ